MEVNADLNKPMGLFNRPESGQPPTQSLLHTIHCLLLSTADSAENDDVIMLLLLSAGHLGCFCFKCEFPKES